jgi:ferric-dicitrate binding protein FerR (iron transport regulator)
MSVIAAKAAPRRRGGYRLIIILLVVLLIVGAGFFWLSTAAQAASNAAATLTVYQPTVSVASGGTAFLPAKTGTVVQPGDSVKTDAKGRASIQLPDGTLTRMAGGTEITLTSAHFAKTGNLHDASILQKAGRTFTYVQHLVAGATFQVRGQSAVASVRGTKFEVVINADGTMVVKLFDGVLDLDGKNHVHMVAPQQATVDGQGNVGPAGPILSDPNDPFVPQIQASDASNVGTTPGTEQDFLGAPIHNGEQQSFTYSFPGGSVLKAALGYHGSSMELRLKGPDGKVYSGTGASPIVVAVANGTPGIYTVTALGVSGLGTGEEPFISVSALEPCASAAIAINGAVRRAYTGHDLGGAISVPGLTNLNLAIVGDSIAGAIITGSGTYNGVSWTGTVVLFRHGGVLAIFAVGATVFNVSVPAQQIVQQIGSAIGQDPSNINPGFVVDRLFSCQGVLMMEGRT